MSPFFQNRKRPSSMRGSVGVGLLLIALISFLKLSSRATPTGAARKLASGSTLTAVNLESEPAKAPIQHEGDVPLRAAQIETVKADLKEILQKAGLDEDSIQLDQVVTSTESKNEVQVRCVGLTAHLHVSALPEEWSATFYYGLQKLGFLFPHPRLQISPTIESVRAKCGSTFIWEPRLRYRGFHLHTEHPNEWVAGFLENQSTIAEDTIRWLARNGQNLFEIVLLRSIPLETYSKNLKSSFELAKQFGILRGLSVSFALTQQRSYRLIEPFYENLHSSNSKLLTAVKNLERAVDFDFLSADLGTSEFTSTSYDTTLQWIETARQELDASGKRLFTKNHISSNQNNKKYGNFNFITRFANSSVGVLPHTVMFYGFTDEHTPVYGNQNFSSMAQFLSEQTAVRPTWYFPETTYWVGQDIDVPLFLTDYLVSRSSDLDFLEHQGGTGEMDFTSGQELGYWLMDWTLTLLNQKENKGNPMIGLDLLGENAEVWKTIFTFQTKYFKEDQLIAILSASTLLDELPAPFKSPVQARHTLKELSKNPLLLQDEISRLQSAVADLPAIDGVKNTELKSMMSLTHARIEHALLVRQAMAEKNVSERERFLEQATQLRTDSTRLMQSTIQANNRYPETSIYDWKSNPTSYDFQYLWAAKTLHFWEREESMIRKKDYSAEFDNIYNPLKLVF